MAAGFSKVAVLLLLGVCAAIAAHAQVTVDQAGVEMQPAKVGDEAVHAEVETTQDEDLDLATLWKKAVKAGKCVYMHKIVDCDKATYMKSDYDSDSHKHKGSEKHKESKKHSHKNKDEDKEDYNSTESKHKSGSKHKYHKAKDTKHTKDTTSKDTDYEPANPPAEDSYDSNADAYGSSKGAYGKGDDGYDADGDAELTSVNKGPGNKGLWNYGWSSSGGSYGGSAHRKYVSKHSKHSKYHSALEQDSA